MKKIMAKKWFFPLAVGFFLCAIALGAQLTYGAYVRRSYIKAVIATNETEKLFGSNLLYGVKTQPSDPASDDWLTVYPYTVADGTQESITIPIKIYNYLFEDQDRINQLDVSYIISFQVAGEPGDMTKYFINGYPVQEKGKTYYLAEGGLTDSSGSAATQTLPGRLAHTNTYHVTIPGSDLGKVSIAVKAERKPNEGSGNYGTDLLYLAARVVPNLASTVQTATVTGEFANANEGTPGDYAAYNYRIELSGAPTAVVLAWDSDLLEIDPFFEEKFGVKPQSNQVVFNMEPGIKTVQFYRSGNVDGADWNALGVSVSER